MSAVTPPPADMVVTSSVYLPVELIEEILSKSPVKSVLRFKSVSKQWHAIISDPRFSRLHCIQQSKLSENQNMFYMFIFEPNNPLEVGSISSMRLEDGKLTTVTEFHHHQYYYTPLCCCNGVFLLTDIHLDYILWNPSTRKSTIIKQRPITYPSKPLKCHLYHDETSDDYKIVFVYRVVGEKSDSDHGYAYMVYSCKNRSWGEMLDFPFNSSHIRYCHDAFVDGCLYYLSSCNSEIVFFDFRDGKLDKFPQPNYLEEGELEIVQYVKLKDISGRLFLEEEEFEIFQYVRLMAISGRLCLCSHTYEESGDELRRYTRFQLWVMERNENLEHCWKLISTDMEKENDIFSRFRALCFSNEDNVVIEGLYKEYSKPLLYIIVVKRGFK